MSNGVNKPNYYAILTADVRYDDRLKPNEKLLFAEITALANYKGYCSASNSYFSKLYKVHKNTVGNWVNRLVELGYIKSELVFNDKRQIVARRLYIKDLPINEKIDTPINEKVDTPINEKVDTPINEKIDTSQQKDWEGINEIIEGNNTSKNITSKNNNTPIPPFDTESEKTGHGNSESDDLDTNSNSLKTNSIKKNSNKTNVQKSKREGYSEAFERWWAIYPRRAGKGRAYQLWKRDGLDKRVDELIEKLEQQNAMQYAFTDPKYIPMASTYLNQKRYDDDIEFRGNSNESSTNSNQSRPADYQQMYEDEIRELQGKQLQNFNGRF